MRRMRQVRTNQPSNMNPRIYAAQSHYAAIGLYPKGEIDGVDGPLTQRADDAFLDQLKSKARVDLKETAASVVSPLQIARSLLNVAERPGSNSHNPIILQMFKDVGADWYDTDETAWCGAFCGACHLKAKYETPLPSWKSVTAKEWLKVGDKVWSKGEDIKNIRRAKEGDILIFERKGGGHVGFLAAPIPASGKSDPATVLCLGGNQSNRVNLQTFPVSLLIGIRRTAPNIKS